MSKHILGIQLLDSPYKMVAADVNNSKTITTLDVIELRKLLLNIETKFNNNNSWRFIPRNYAFPDRTNPWKPLFPEVININNLEGAITNQDFVAIKIGDISVDAEMNAFESVSRNIVGQFAFQLDEQDLELGQEYQIDFRAKDLNQIQGYQMTLQLDRGALKVKDIVYGIAQPTHFGMRMIEEGLLATSWNKAVNGAITYEEDEVVFSLVLQATKNVRLSEVIQVSNRITVAEAYDMADQLLDVALDYGSGQLKTNNFEVYQNVPNPFGQETTIGFYLPEESPTSIRIYDLSGRTLKLINGTFARGRNQIQLNKEDLGAAGILYYTITAGKHTATRKMIVVD